MNINSIVAANLKLIREKEKLSLDNVAKMTSVSKSMLGQIEREEVNPTISVLWKIANGLKISFTSLMETPTDDTEIIRANDTDPLIENDGKYINYPVFLFDENRRFEIYRIKILPDGSLDALAHLPGTEEFITVYSGNIVISVEGVPYSLSTGDSIRFKADAAHSYRNAGRSTAELSMVIYYAK